MAFPQRDVHLNVDAPLDRFSWYDDPPQSKLKSGGSTSLAICSTRWIPWPELMPGAVCPITFTAGRLLKRSSESGPDEYLTSTSDASGIIPPLSLLHL